MCNVRGQKWNVPMGLLDTSKLPAQGRKPEGDTSVSTPTSTTSAQSRQKPTGRSSRPRGLGGSPAQGRVDGCLTRVQRAQHSGATFTSSKGKRSWKMRLIRAPPESSSVSTWSPEPSILFSKSTPNCWTILPGKREPEHQKGRF